MPGPPATPHIHRTIQWPSRGPSSPHRGLGPQCFAGVYADREAFLAPSALSSRPSFFLAGDTVKWPESPADFPTSESWALTVSLRGPGTLEKAAAVNGSVYDVELTATETAKLKPGQYQGAIVMTKAGERYTAVTWVFTVAADLPAADAGDLMAFPEKLLPLVEQEIYNRLNGQRSIERYSIAGRSFDKITITELMALRGRLKGELAAARNQGRFGVPIGAEFGRPS